MTRNAQWPSPPYTPPITSEFNSEPDMPINRVIACVWWGTKYPFDYVAKLKAAVDTHLSAYGRFICLTDRVGQVEDLLELGIEPIVTDVPWGGWWQKVRLFDPALYQPGERVLMVDLDLVLTGDLDLLFAAKHHTTAIANFGVNFRHSKYNSSMVLFDPEGPAQQVYKTFILDADNIMGGLHGDQCWFWRALVDDVRVWPPTWALSYKYDVRTKGKGSGLLPDTRAVVFHGSPDPHQVQDAFVIQNWHSL